MSKVLFPLKKGKIQGLLLLALVLLLIITGCTESSRLQLVEVGLASPAKRNSITSSYSLKAEDWDLWYASFYYGPEESSYGATYTSGQEPYYHKLTGDEKILLSQGPWEILILFTPHSDAPLTRGTKATINPSQCLEGTTGRVNVNLSTEYLVFKINQTSNVTEGKVIVDVRMPSSLVEGATISATVSSIADDGTLAPLSTPDVTMPSTGETLSGSILSYVGERTLDSGLYFMTVNVTKSSKTLLSDQIAFQVHAGFETTITAVVDTLHVTPASGTGFIEKTDNENTDAAADGSNSNGFVYGNYIQYDQSNGSSSGSGSGGSSGSDTPTAGSTTSSLKEISPEYIYAIVSSDNTLPHADDEETSQTEAITQERIVLGNDGTQEGRYGLDLNGNTLQIARKDNTGADENMTVVSVNENQTFTLFNNGTKDAQLFGSNMSTGSNSAGRYDATIVVNGGGFYCAPDGYSASSLQVSGPFCMSSAKSTDNGVVTSYVKQGAINIDGNGGLVRLNTSNVIVGEVSGSENDTYAQTHTVKGITTYKPENGYTSLNSGAEVDISVTNGARISVTCDTSDNADSSSSNYSMIREVTNGYDRASAIYVTGRYRANNASTGTLLSTSADVDILIDSESKLVCSMWSGHAKQLITGMYVGYIDGPVDITMKDSELAVRSNWSNRNDNFSSGYWEVAGIVLEHLSQTANVKLENSKIFDQTNANYINNIFINDCTGTINITLDNTILSSNIYTLVIENCTGTVNLNIKNAGSDPLKDLTNSGKDVFIRNCSTAFTLNVTVDDSPAGSINGRGSTGFSASVSATGLN